jgi:hypothetical protein
MRRPGTREVGSPTFAVESETTANEVAKDASKSSARSAIAGAANSAATIRTADIMVDPGD